MYMELDLSKVALFDCDTLCLDKPINFIFGKNGTGKSTLCQLIKDQNTEKDVRVYQGVESVSIDGKLNTVILGEENVSAQNNIKRLNEEIEGISQEKQKVVKQLEELQSKIDKVSEKKGRQEKEIKDFYTKSARDIKNNPLHIAITTYNSKLFEEELRYAHKLIEYEEKECKDNIKLEERIATNLVDINIDFKKILDETNRMLESSVEEETQIVRLDTNQKINFAKTGFEIHSKGDICTFCGNSISDNTFNELEKFFSVSKIKEFEDELHKLIDRIESEINAINKIDFDKMNFYNSYHNEIEELAKIWGVLAKKQESFLRKVKAALESKLTQMFSKSAVINLEIPESSSQVFKEYADIVRKNNAEDVARIKKYSQDLLRFHLIWQAIQKFEYDDKDKSLEISKKEIEKFNKEKEELEKQKSEFDEKIWAKRDSIQEENNKTKSESKLANNINKKLGMYVAFELEHMEATESSHQGHYRIRNKGSLEPKYREIHTLSEGEKNILGFLYFVEKLNEYQDTSRDKIIVFDDPMDSNDDMMQYIIVTEIQELMKRIEKKRMSDSLVILTHNSHFYINVKYNRLYEDGKDRFGSDKIGDRFIRLQKKDSRTMIKVLDSEGQDFSTSYELLWKELRFLYDNDKPDLMLNSIRRIIETYTKFNRNNNFYGDNKEAQKLFNVNSHSIDDLEAELNGKTKEQIINLMKECFNSNDAKNHFDLHWKSSRK